MISDEAFRLAIRSFPDDDAPRLVYADWLEEVGDAERAEFIRLQCCGKPSEREKNLRSHFHMHWSQQLGHMLYGFEFRRGFVEEITVEARMFLELGEQILADAPIRLLRLIRARDVMDRLARSPLLRGLRSLHLTDCAIGDEGAELLASSTHVGDLQTLRLGNNAVKDRGVQALAESSGLGSLRTLVLSDNQIRCDGAYALATSGRFPRLDVLDLRNNEIGALGAEALAHSSALSRLTRLVLADQFKGSTAEDARRGRPYPIQPKQQRALRERYGAEACVF